MLSLRTAAQERWWRPYRAWSVMSMNEPNVEQQHLNATCCVCIARCHDCVCGLPYQHFQYQEVGLNLHELGHDATDCVALPV